MFENDSRNFYIVGVCWMCSGFFLEDAPSALKSVVGLSGYELENTIEYGG